MTNILISVTIFAITVFFGPAHSYFESCIGKRCFTITSSNETKNFDDAKNWCKDRNSNLAVVNDENTQEALTQFLNSAQLSEQPKLPMFIDLKLEMKVRKWYLVNGAAYLGGIAEQDTNDYRFYGYAKVRSNGFSACSSKPSSLRNFICEFGNTRCSNNSPNNYVYNASCFVKFENENLTWSKARESCHYSGGDLATFNYPANTWNWPEEIPFNTYWLNQSLSYWVGLRFSDWHWISSGDVGETIYSSWASDKPNNINYECVCVDPNGNPAWGWTDCSCTEPRQFVCLKIVPTTTASRSSSATMSSTVSFPFADVTNSPSTSSVNNALIVGLVLGIAVILPLLIIILISAIIIQRQRQSRERTQNNDRSVTQLEAVAAPDANYQHLNRQTMFVPGSEMPHYDQLNPIENKDYELSQ